MRTIDILIILATICVLSSCEQPLTLETGGEELKPQLNNVTHKNIAGHYEVLLIDNCQYILFSEKVGINLGYGYLSHKGNCSNSIHLYQNPDTLVQVSQKNIKIPGGEKEGE